MKRLERLEAMAALWRKHGGPEPPAPDWVGEAAAEGVLAARDLAARLEDPRPLEAVHLERLHALSRAWEYCDAILDVPPDLHLALGDWADALMVAERHSRRRLAELAPFVGRFDAAEAARDPRRALKWWLRVCKVS